MITFNFAGTKKDKFADAKKLLNKIEHMLLKIDISKDNGSSYLEINSDTFRKVSINDGVGTYAKLLNINDNEKKIISFMEKNGYVVEHFHKNERELIYVLFGEIHNKTNGKTYKKGEWFISDKMQKHYICANENSGLFVSLAHSEPPTLLESDKIISNNVLKAFMKTL